MKEGIIPEPVLAMPEPTLAMPEPVLVIAMAFLLVALVLTLFRLVKGPTMNDRILAMDLTASVAMGFILLYSMVLREGMYFDIAIVIALVSFMGTVAISTYLKIRR